jgi:hypothetical protein
MRERRRGTKHIATPAEKPTSVWLTAFLFSESTHYNRQFWRTDTGGFCDLTSACRFVAVPRCSGAEPWQAAAAPQSKSKKNITSDVDKKGTAEAAAPT